MMKKFSITSLETARKNPKAFAQTLNSDESTSGGFGGYPKSMRWLNAVCKYHEKNDTNDGFNSLEQAFSSRKNTTKNRRELEKFLLALDEYHNEIIRRQLSLIKSREAIEIIFHSQIRITGIIPLIYMKPDIGFAGYFISELNTNWITELKFPVVQNYLAQKVFNTDSSTIDIGYINFHTGEMISNCFTSSEINSSMVELKTVGEAIVANLK